MAKGAACLNVSYRGHVIAFNGDYKEIAVAPPVCAAAKPRLHYTPEKTFSIDALFEVVSTSKQ